MYVCMTKEKTCHDACLFYATVCQCCWATGSLPACSKYACAYVMSRLWTIVFPFFSFCLHFSSLTACHLLNLIACAVATTSTLDCGLFLRSHFSYCYWAPPLCSLSHSLSPSCSPSGVCTLCLFATGLTSFFTPTLIVRLHFSTGSLAVYLFILAANTFAFRFVPQLPKGAGGSCCICTNVCMNVHTHILIMYFMHVCTHCICMCECLSWVSHLERKYHFWLLCMRIRFELLYAKRLSGQWQW